MLTLFFKIVYFSLLECEQNFMNFISSTCCLQDPNHVIGLRAVTFPGRLCSCLHKGYMLDTAQHSNVAHAFPLSSRFFSILLSPLFSTSSAYSCPKQQFLLCLCGFACCSLGLECNSLPGPHGSCRLTSLDSSPTCLLCEIFPGPHSVPLGWIPHLPGLQPHRMGWIFPSHLPLANPHI